MLVISESNKLLNMFCSVSHRLYRLRKIIFPLKRCNRGLKWLTRTTQRLTANFPHEAAFVVTMGDGWRGKLKKKNVLTTGLFNKNGTFLIFYWM